jgi:hypothetical protein
MNGRDKMAKGDIETYFEDGVWKNRRQGSSRAFNVEETKAEASQEGRAAAIRDGVEHLIKKRDGTIQERNTYPRRRDPRRSKG